MKAAVLGWSVRAFDGKKIVFRRDFLVGQTGGDTWSLSQATFEKAIQVWPGCTVSILAMTEENRMAEAIYEPCSS